MRSGLVSVAAVAMLSVSLCAQGGDPVFVLAATGSGGANSGALLTFDRGLMLQATLPSDYPLKVYGVCTDSQRRLWVPWPSTHPQVLRVDATGRAIDSVVTPQTVMSLVAGPQGDIFGLMGNNNAALGLDSDGNVLWTLPLGSSFYGVGFSYYILKPCLTAGGELWFGGVESCIFFYEYPVLALVDTVDGGFPGPTIFPGFAECGIGYIGQLAAALDGSMWAWLSPSIATGYKPTLVRTDGVSVLQTIVHDSLEYGTFDSPYLSVDGLGQVLCNVYSNHYCWEIWCDCWGTAIRSYDPETGANTATHELGGVVRGFTLGPTGEEVFAVVTVQSGRDPSADRLVRVNLVSGARSTVLLPTDWPHGAIPHGDSTGFAFANTVDRAGDVDGDGAANGTETAAGSNSFDPESRPDGPKVYVSFAPGTNAIEMTLFDPDGIRHLTKGVDFATMSVTIGGSGNVFWPLLGLVTDASLSADGKTAHAVFGGLPLASDLKLRVEMSVRDRTGAVGWDWQATPPGDL